MNKVCHIIVAAGTGSRFGGRLPKQFCEMKDGRPVLMTTLDRMEGDKVLVISREMEQLWRELCERNGFSSPRIVFGGATRWESVKNALATIPGGYDVITVHDGARPLVDRELIERVVSPLLEDNSLDGTIPAVEVTDSLREITSEGNHAADRRRFRAVQTPQGFRAELLREAYLLPYRETFTDDASVMEAAGYSRLKLVEGDPKNIKITRPGDIEIAEIYLASER